MRRLVILATAAALTVAGAAPGTAALLDRMPPEGCEAVNPGQPKCTFRATHNTTGPVSGAAGEGKWVVVVKRGRKTITLKSPSSGEPAGVEFLYKKGDKVTAKALSAGSSVIAGGE